MISGAVADLLCSDLQRWLMKCDRGGVPVGCIHQTNLHLDESIASPLI